MRKIIEKIKERINTLGNQNQELLWAKIWDDTKTNIIWIDKLPGLSPGRWAVGYNYLYVMPRILNEKKPRCVLDLGLGISSSLISAYFEGCNVENGIHDVIEQDETWISFYRNANRLSQTTNIHHVEVVEKNFDGVVYYAYEDISSIIKNKKYDVISVDGPWGSAQRSRRDIVEYIPEILNDSFVIVFDDSERNGERNTIEEIKKRLKDKGVDYCEGVYQSLKSCTVICSYDNRFFCSL